MRSHKQISKLDIAIAKAFDVPSSLITELASKNGFEIDAVTIHRAANASLDSLMKGLVLPSPFDAMRLIPVVAKEWVFVLDNEQAVKDVITTLKDNILAAKSIAPSLYKEGYDSKDIKRLESAIGFLLDDSMRKRVEGLFELAAKREIVKSVKFINVV